VWRTRQHMGVARSLWMAFMVPLDVQKCSLIVSLKASSCPLHVGATRVGVGGSGYRWWTFIFSFYFISPPLKITV